VIGNWRQCLKLTFLIFVGFIFAIVVFYNDINHDLYGLNHTSLNLTTNKFNQIQSIPWIGLTPINITEEVSNVLDVEKGKGILINDITPGGPAENAGLREGKETAFLDNKPISLGGDIIINADNKTITNVKEFNNALKQKEIGDNFNLTVLRDGQIKKIGLVVESKSIQFEDTDNRGSRILKFLPYYNFDMGIEMLYPFNWIKDENKAFQDQSITFRSPVEDINDTKVYLKLNKHPKSNENLDDELNTKLPLMGLSMLSPANDALIFDTHARMLLYKYMHENDTMIKSMRVATQIDDNVYMFTYSAEQSKFDEYLPIVKEMINSSKILQLKQFENFDLGMRMTYPTTWNVIEDDYSYIPSSFIHAQKIILNKIKENFSREIPPHLEILASDEDKGIGDSLNNLIKYYETANNTHKYYNFNLISSNLSNGAMGSFHNITYSYGDPKFGKILETHLITLQNERIYSISYEGKKEEFQTNMPIFNKMVETIDFFKTLPILGKDPDLLINYPSDLFNVTNGKNEFSFDFGFMDYDYPYIDPKLTIKINNNNNNGKYNLRESNFDLYTTQSKPIKSDKMLFTQQYKNGTIQELNVITSYKNKIYNFTYIAEPDEFYQILPTIDNIINSTRIVDPLSGNNEPLKPNFISYNSKYGFKISYPADWEKPLDYGSNFVDVIPKLDDNASNNYTKEGYSGLIRIFVTPSENSTLMDFIESDMMTSITGLDENIKIVYSNKMSYGKNETFQILYASKNSLTFKKYILNEENDKFYLISYTNNVNNFYNLLPILNEITKSFEIINFGKPNTHTGFKVGDGPIGIAVNPNTNTVYVANSLSNTVSVISGSNDKILKNITTTNSPSQLAVDPLKNLVYVSQPGLISVIDGKNNTILQNIPISAKSPMSISLDPDTNKIYVADDISKNISVIDIIDNEELLTIPTGKGKEADQFQNGVGIGVVVDQFRKKIYVANPSTNNISIIDEDSNKILSNISATINPYDIAIDPFSNTAYIVGADELAKIDLSTNKIGRIETKGSSFNTVVINPFTNIVYVPDMDKNIVYVIDPSRDIINKTISVDSMPTFAAINPNTNIVYVSNTFSDSVTKINGDSNKVLYGVGFDLRNRPINYNILGSVFSVNASDSVNVYCRENNGNMTLVVNGSYRQYDNGTHIFCEAAAKNTFFPLVSASWSGLDMKPPIDFDINGYGIIGGSFIDLGNLLQKLSPVISFMGLGIVIVVSTIYSIIRRSSKPDKNEIEEILSKSDIITIDASVVVGVLIFLSLSDGFAMSEQTQITIITANIVFPFAISAVVAVRNHEKFAISLMIAGFINLMISILLIALMKL
jgi:YVTN family beta-propeller protein